MSVPMLPTADSLRTTEAAFTKRFSEQRLTDSLIRALRPHWRGLERKLVFQAMRARYLAIGQCVPFEFEAAIVRIFQKSCVNTDGLSPRSGTALFHRRQETRGEIWTLNAEQADAWLDTK
jgi:hypothetical protein